MEVSPESIQILDQYIGLKYGVPSPAGNQAIRCLAQLEGIFTDPVYTGKALSGMIDYVQTKKRSAKPASTLLAYRGYTGFICKG